MLRKSKEYYIESTPPKHGTFVHHSHYTALSMIAIRGSLNEGKPWRGISLTTDPGRFLSAMPMLHGFGCTVDGFVEFDAAPLIQENLVAPCLYRTINTELVDMARI